MTWFGYLCDRYDAWLLSLGFYVVVFGLFGWITHGMFCERSEEAYTRAKPYLWFFHITSFIAVILLLLLPSKEFVCGC